MKPQRFEAYAIFSDTDGYCDCNEVTPYPVEFEVLDGFTERKVMVIDLEEFEAMQSEATSDAELIKRLNASLAEARAERDRLREALTNLLMVDDSTDAFDVIAARKDARKALEGEKV